MINSILSFSHDGHLPYSTYNWRNSICRGMNDLNTLRTQEMLHILIIWLRDHRDSGSLLPCPKPSEPEAVNNAPPTPPPLHSRAIFPHVFITLLFFCLFLSRSAGCGALGAGTTGNTPRLSCHTCLRHGRRRGAPGTD